MKSRFFAAAHCVLILALVGGGQALAIDKAYITGDKTWDKCSSLQEEWLSTLHEIVVSEKARLKDAADLSLKWRFTAIKVNSLKFKYLLQTDSSRIIRDKGLKAFVELDWYWDDSRELGKTNLDFLNLESEMKALEKANSSHADWPELKSYLRTLAKSPAHKEKFDKFLSDLTGAMRNNEAVKTSTQ